MSTWKLTRKAQADFAEIVLYTTDTWGQDQAEKYAALLLDGFDIIAQKPGVGRSCDNLGLRLRRFERGKHVLFYRPDRSGILISRILHQQMLPAQTHFMGA